MPMRTGRGGFTLLELVISLAVVGVLLVLLLPVLTSARMSSRRALCAGNQRLLGHAWSDYLQDNGKRFPVLYVQAAWMYGGVRFSTVDGSPFLDYDRPLNRYVPPRLGEILFHCPADRGITDERGTVGTGRRSAFEAFGSSYRANTELLGPHADRGHAGLGRDEITTAPSRLVRGLGGYGAPRIVARCGQRRQPAVSRRRGALHDHPTEADGRSRGVRSGGARAGVPEVNSP